MQPQASSGIANQGRAYIYGSQADFSPLSEGPRLAMLQRQMEAQKRLEREQQYNKMMPEVNGDVFYWDTPALKQKADTVTNTMAELRAKGIDPYDLSNPISQRLQQELNDYRYSEGVSKQWQQQFKEMTKQYQDDVANGKAMPGFFENEWKSFIQGYQPLSGTPLPVPSAYSNYDGMGTMKTALAAIEDGSIDTMFNKGGFYGTNKITSKDPESLNIVADQLYSDPRHSEFVAAGYQALPNDLRNQIDSEASKNGITPQMQYGRYLMNKLGGAQRQDLSVSKVSASDAMGWAKMRRDEQLGDAILQQTARIFDPKLPEILQNDDQYLNKLFQGNGFGTTGEKISNVRRDGTKLIVTTEMPAKYNFQSGTWEGGQQRERTIGKDDVFQDFVTQIVRGTFGGDSDNVLGLVYDVYKKKYGGDDFSTFDPTKVFPEFSGGGQTPLGTTATRIKSQTASSRYGN